MSSDDVRRVAQTPLFGRKIKRFTKKEKAALDEEVRRFISNPEIGEAKKGELQGIRVHKYRFSQHEMLFAYSFTEKELLLITIGSHENYYRDFKRYIR